MYLQQPLEMVGACSSMGAVGLMGACGSMGAIGLMGAVGSMGALGLMGAIASGSMDGSRCWLDGSCR
jgi:hypothetical protein